jgi:TRAP-type C4-dicarboxylate transport system permease small subunit
MNFMSRLTARIDAMFRAMLALLMAAMVLCVTWQVVSRYLLGDPSSWTEELARFLLIWIGLLGASYAYHVKMHLGLDVLTQKLQGNAAMWHARFVHGVVILFAATVLVGGGLRLMQLTYELRQYSPALDVPMAWVYCCLPVSGAMLIFYAVIALFSARDDAPAALRS